MSLSFAPLWSLPPAVALHLATALVAIALGPVALYRRGRDTVHRVVGYTWVAAMLLVALSSFALSAEILPLVAGFGPIHLLSLWALWQLQRGVAAVRAGDVRRHHGIMRGLYWTGPMIAGLFTLLPGRLLNRVLFPDMPEAGFVAIAVGGVALVWINLRLHRGPGIEPA